MAKDVDIAEYDIIFMDVNMKDLDGIETDRQIRTYTTKTYIVFVTSFINYSLEGYKVDAILYIESKLHKLEFHLIGQDTKVYTTYGSLNDVAKEL